MLIILAGAIELSTATSTSSAACRRINECKHSATLDHLVVTIVSNVSFFIFIRSASSLSFALEARERLKKRSYCCYFVNDVLSIHVLNYIT